MDRYSGRSYRSKRLEFRFAIIAVHSPIAVHGPIAVQPEFFKFPRRNVPVGISPSTDFSAFSSFRRETCESTSLSALIFVPFQEQKKFWRGLPGIFVRCVVLFLSFFFFLFDTVRCLFKRRREKVWRGTPWFKEGNTHRETNLFSKCQLIAVWTRSLGGLSPRSVCSWTFGEITTVLLPGVWAGLARDQRCNTSSASGSFSGRANALCKTVSASF